MSDQDNQENKDFAQVLAEFEQEAPAKSEEPAVGEKVSGHVSSIGEESVFVDLGAKSEATTLAPSRAQASAKFPSPAATSSTSWPADTAQASASSRAAGSRRCERGP